MTTRLRSAALGLTVLLPSMAEAQPATPRLMSEQDHQVGLLERLVVVRSEIEGGSEISDVLRADMLAVLRDAKVDPALPDDAPLELLVAPDPDELGAYRVVFSHRGERLEAWSCLCSGDELRARLRVTTIRAWEAASRPLADDAPESEPAVEGEVAPPPTPAAEPRPRRSRRRGSALFITGLSATALGGSGVLGSVVGILYARRLGVEVPPGAFAAVGAAAALGVAGVPMLIVGKRRHAQATMVVGPAGPGRGLTLGVRGRF